ncbi:hypothetical protein R6Q57_000143 [Mikania cordata]
MSSTSSTAHSVNKNPKIFKIDLDRNLYCKHDLIAVRRVVQRKSSRIGQEFYGCPLWPVNTMFREHESCMTSLLPENPKSYEVMKMRNLELEKMLLTEENKHLKEMLQKSNANLLAVDLVNTLTGELGLPHNLLSLSIGDIVSLLAVNLVNTLTGELGLSHTLSLAIVGCVGSLLAADLVMRTTGGLQGWATEWAWANGEGPIVDGEGCISWKTGSESGP